MSPKPVRSEAEEAGTIVDAGAGIGDSLGLVSALLPGAGGSPRLGLESGADSAALAGGVASEVIGSCRTVSVSPFSFLVVMD